MQLLVYTQMLSHFEVCMPLMQGDVHLEGQSGTLDLHRGLSLASAAKLS